MIKTKKGKTQIKGSDVEIIADLTCIAKTIFTGFEKDMPKEEIKEKMHRSIDIATMTEEELDESISQLFKKKLKELLDDTDEGNANAD
jgi:hypothetical protein